MVCVLFSWPPKFRLSSCCVVVLCTACLLVVGSELNGLEGYQEKPGVKQVLTPDEELSVRKTIYTPGITVSVSGPGDLKGARILVVGNEITQLHEKKRAATLHLLLEIVKGGRPEDALKAAGFVFALEGDPITGAITANRPPELFDEAIGMPPTTRRALLMESLQKTVSNNDKKKKDNGSKLRD